MVSFGRHYIFFSYSTIKDEYIMFNIFAATPSITMCRPFKNHGSTKSIKITGGSNNLTVDHKEQIKLACEISDLFPEEKTVMTKQESIYFWRETEKLNQS
jgi:hypothetical protein